MAVVHTTYNAGWKINQNDEACYIEIDGDENCVADEDEISSRWCNLPDLLLEQIFSYLTIRERYYCSLTCRNWYRVFYLKNVWRNFRISDDTLCRQKYNYYSGWQPVLDCLRAQNCLSRVGRFVKGIEILPTYNFNNISQFMSLLTFNVQQSRRENCSSSYFEVGQRIESFKYLFPCNMANSEQDVKLYGTGGQLLKTLKALLYELNRLKRLKLIDLLLERYEAKHLLDAVLESCSTALQHLVLVNVTSTHCPILHVGLFFNLKVLIISPQNLDDDVLQLLASTSLRHLYILQNSYCPTTPAACSAKAWKAFGRDAPTVKVHLRFERFATSTLVDLTLQPHAPVHSVTYRSPWAQLTSAMLIEIVDMYKDTLTTFGHESLPDFKSPEAFDERIDSLLLLMARQCPKLTNLTVRESVSTSTLLLLAKTAVNLRVLHVRKSVVVVKQDWPKKPEWSDDFYHWLQVASRSRQATEREISHLLGCRWTMLSDESFTKLEIDLPGFVL